MEINDSLNVVYYEKTKINYKEVLSSYSIGNYRSAIVMLYCTVMFDLFLKLEELSKNNTNKNAIEILKVWQTKIEGDIYYNENEVVDKMAKENLISNKTATDINYLYKQRCLCAHPSAKESTNLYVPDKNIVLGLISIMCKEVLSQPPYFAKNLSNFITDEIITLKNALPNDAILEYIKTKYLIKMNEFGKEKTFKGLWDLCFNKPNDAKCLENVQINTDCLINICLMYPDVLQKCKQSNFDFQFDRGEVITEYIFYFFAKICDSFNCLSETNKKIIREKAKGRLSLISWFLYDNIDDFVKKIDDYCSFSISGYTRLNVQLLYEKMCILGRKQVFLSWAIRQFNNCNDFNEASAFYNMFIDNYLSCFNVDQINLVLKICNTNRCIYDSFSFKEIAKIQDAYTTLTGKKINELEYPNMSSNQNFIK